MTADEYLPDSLAIIYTGRILAGNFSENLKQRVSRCIIDFAAFDLAGTSAIPYISSWQENAKAIWYEFAGRRFYELFGITGAHVDLVTAFKNSIIERRVYHYKDMAAKIQEEVLPGSELAEVSSGLRAQGKRSGTVEAVYQVALGNKSIIWLKDQANIETYDTDGVCLSLGNLTDVTKEMEQKALLEDIGYFDELTRLPKRKILHRLLEINISQFQRGSVQDFIFLMIDIDYFKKVNDTLGHLAGDHVLAAMAEVMSLTKRKGDEIGRWGGEEFYGVSHGDIQTGRDFAERLRRTIEKTPCRYQDHTIYCTVSIGMVSASQLSVLNAEELIRVADERLYAAKKQGRNRVVWSEVENKKISCS